MREINFAVNDRQIENTPTDAQAHRLGVCHKGYGWACTPYGHWSERHKEMYRRGFRGEAMTPDILVP